MTAQASTAVSVRNVTGRWTATFPPVTGLQPEPIDLVQNQTAVTVTINDTANLLGFGSGTGTVSNPLSLITSATFRQGTPIAFAVTYVGRVSGDDLNTWSGTVTGYAGCPCTFTATRPTSVGDWSTGWPSVSRSGASTCTLNEDPDRGRGARLARRDAGYRVSARSTPPGGMPPAVLDQCRPLSKAV